MIDSILIICVGNICRSPLAERLLAHKLETAGLALPISSAGIGALVGQGADLEAAAFAKTQGVTLEHHVARQFTPEMGKASSLLLVMEPGHRQQISKQSPELSGRIMLFDHWTGARGISDPYRQSREFHAAVYTRIEDAATAWAHRLGARKDHQA